MQNFNLMRFCLALPFQLFRFETLENFSLNNITFPFDSAIVFEQWRFVLLEFDAVQLEAGIDETDPWITIHRHFPIKEQLWSR